MVYKKVVRDCSKFRKLNAGFLRPNKVNKFIHIKYLNYICKNITHFL